MGDGRFPRQRTKKKLPSFGTGISITFWKFLATHNTLKMIHSLSSLRDRRYSVAPAAVTRAYAIAEHRRLCFFNCARQSTARDLRKGLASRSSVGENGYFLPARCTWIDKGD